MTLAIPWHQMTPREQLVWAASYARHADQPLDAVRLANQTIQKLHALDVDNRQFSGPEYDAARHDPGLTFEEFRAWYPVALKIAKRGHVAFAEVTEDACREAFEVYRRCSTDFY